MQVAIFILIPAAVKNNIILIIILCKEGQRTTGRKVEHKTTTDYTLAIESITSGSADIAMAMGAAGYIEAKNRNPQVDVLFVNADKEGKLDGAKYFSRLCVPVNKGDDYKSGGTYTIDAEAPFNAHSGKEFMVISSTPVFNGPNAYNPLMLRNVFPTATFCVKLLLFHFVPPVFFLVVS